MEINVLNDSKLIEIWLINEEKNNATLKEQLHPLYDRYKQKKYLVAVFESGECDSCKATSDLLSRNRKQLAEKKFNSSGSKA